MAETNDSGIIEEVRTLLSENKAISTKSALKLSLRLQVKMYNQLKEQGGLITANTKRLDVVERLNIVMWMQRHPKLAIFIITIILIAGTIIDLRVVLAKALGIDL